MVEMKYEIKKKLNPTKTTPNIHSYTYNKLKLMPSFKIKLGPGTQNQ